MPPNRRKQLQPKQVQRWNGLMEETESKTINNHRKNRVFGDIICGIGSKRFQSFDENLKDKKHCAIRRPVTVASTVHITEEDVNFKKLLESASKKVKIEVEMSEAQTPPSFNCHGGIERLKRSLRSLQTNQTKQMRLIKHISNNLMKKNDRATFVVPAHKEEKTFTESHVTYDVLKHVVLNSLKIFERTVTNGIVQERKAGAYLDRLYSTRCHLCGKTVGNYKRLGVHLKNVHLSTTPSSVAELLDLPQNVPASPASSQENEQCSPPNLRTSQLDFPTSQTSSGHQQVGFAGFGDISADAWTFQPQNSCADFGTPMDPSNSRQSLGTCVMGLQSNMANISPDSSCSTRYEFSGPLDFSRASTFPLMPTSYENGNYDGQAKCGYGVPNDNRYNNGDCDSEVKIEYESLKSATSICASDQFDQMPRLSKVQNPNHYTICNRKLSCKNALRMHYRTHTGFRPYMCQMCPKFFTTKENLKAHQLNVHAPKTKDMEVTGNFFSASSFPDVNNWTPYINTFDISTAESYSNDQNDTSPTFSNSNPLTPIDHFTAAYTQQFPLSLSYSSPDIRYMKRQPQVDEFSNQSSSPMAYHMPASNNNVECDRFSMLVVNPFNSVVSMPDEQFLKTTRKQGCTCHVCSKTFPSRSALDIHYRSHTNERPFKCNICFHSFTTKGNLKQHLLTHKQQSTEHMFPFQSKYHSKYHNFKAEEDRFNKNDEEFVHQAFPTENTSGNFNGFENGASTFITMNDGDTPSTSASSYQNTEVNCIPAPTQSNMWSVLPESMLTLTNEQIKSTENSWKQKSKYAGLFKHQCQICGKNFSSSSAVQIHMRTHTGVRPFKCNLCGKKFTTKGNLKVHTSTHQYQNGMVRILRTFSPSISFPDKLATGSAQSFRATNVFTRKPTNEPTSNTPSTHILTMLDQVDNNSQQQQLSSSFPSGSLLNEAVNIANGEGFPNNSNWLSFCSICKQLCSSSELSEHLKTHMIRFDSSSTLII